MVGKSILEVEGQQRSPGRGPPARRLVSMVQVGGRSSRDESTLSLLLEHWQLWLLLCFNLVMMDMNQVFLAFLLVQTSSGCGYHEEAGPFVQSQTLTLAAVLLWRPVAGFLTDRLPRYNHILLLGSVILETLGLLTMLLLILLPRSTSNGDAALSPWPILAISVAKQCLEVQLNNSIFKIFKLRLQNHCGLATCDTQCHVISAVGICSELLELVVNLVTCVAAYLLIMAGASFESVKSCYFASTLVASIVCIALAADICRQSPRYYVHVEVDAGEASGTTRGQLQSTLLDGIAATSFSEAASPAAQETSRASSRPANWMQRAIRGVCCEPIALGSITLMLWLYSSQEVLYNVRSLSIPGRHVNNSATPTASNFCAGYLTNMVYQVSRHTRPHRLAAPWRMCSSHNTCLHRTSGRTLATSSPHSSM